jgi:hypothetical protein
MVESPAKKIFIGLDPDMIKAQQTIANSISFPITMQCVCCIQMETIQKSKASNFAAA